MSSGEILVTMFSCCVAPEIDHHRQRHRPRIDRSMIGNPTDFRHTAHIGSSDLTTGSTTVPSTTISPSTGQQKLSKEEEITSGTSGSGLGNGYLTGDCDFSLLKSQMNSKGGDFTAYGRNRMAVHVPHIANARSIDEMRRKI